VVKAWLDRLIVEHHPRPIRFTAEAHRGQGGLRSQIRPLGVRTLIIMDAEEPAMPKGAEVRGIARRLKDAEKDLTREELQRPRHELTLIQLNLPVELGLIGVLHAFAHPLGEGDDDIPRVGIAEHVDIARADEDHRVAALDRKSTRLNSSHVKIAYAVFCLK